MNNYNPNKLLLGLLFSGALGLTGAYYLIKDKEHTNKEKYLASQEMVVGKLIEQNYFGGGDNSSYTLVLNPLKGSNLDKIAVSVMNSGDKKKEGLMSLLSVEQGEKIICFPRGNVFDESGNHNYWETNFQKDTRLGSKFVTRIHFGNECELK